jgi:hypothetical protein
MIFGSVCPHDLSALSWARGTEYGRVMVVAESISRRTSGGDASAVDAKNSGSFVFRDLSGDAERLSGHGAIASGEQLWIAKDFHRFSILAHGWAYREL